MAMNNYEVYLKHLFCGCGGIIGMYDRENFVCEKCGNIYLSYQLDYDYLITNDKTGWLFPVKHKHNNE